MAPRALGRPLSAAASRLLRPLAAASRLLRPLAATGILVQDPSPVAASGAARSFATLPELDPYCLRGRLLHCSDPPLKSPVFTNGRDFRHWLVVMEPLAGISRDEIIDTYVKTLADVVGSVEEARKNIYSVSTCNYFAFGATVSEELSQKLRELPKVRWVLPDSYLDAEKKDYGGEPFIDGKAVPYHPHHHRQYLLNQNYTLRIAEINNHHHRLSCRYKIEASSDSDSSDSSESDSSDVKHMQQKNRENPARSSKLEQGK